jgi:flavin-dependent dehydrogenase
MHDVIVVGARCGGAPTAMLLARRGYRVLLVDRVTFPADKLSTLYIHQPGVARLAKWGVLDAVVASGCPPLDHVVYELGDIRVEGGASPIDGISTAYAPRRTILDKVLVDAAVAAGVELRQGCTVTDVLRDADGAVTGVRMSGPDGVESSERAKLVVGSDGMRSTVARLVGAPVQVEHPNLTCAYYTFWKGPHTYFELYEGDTGWVSAVPTNDDTVLISAYFPQSEFPTVKADVERHYVDNVRTNAPPLYEQMRNAERTERMYGTGDQRNFFRQASGDGWALVGDAGHHKDSLTAWGISDAFLQAELLVDHIGDGLHDDAQLAEALTGYAADRDRLLMERYKATLMVAQADARDRRRALLRAVGSTEDLTQRYFDTVAGVRPMSDLYTPELLAMMQAG